MRALRMAGALQRGDTRYFADHGWLTTHHSFSFAEYYDPRNVNWGALRVLNEDSIAPGTGFGTHPHRDMEILTYVLSGKLEHQDSMGNRGVVGPGGVQFMSAGTGVRHSEYNHSKTEPLHLLQMWVLPGKTGVAPSYGQRDFTEGDRQGRWLAVASGQQGVQAAIALTQNAAMYVSQLQGSPLRHTFEPDRLGFLFVADGEARVELLGGDDAVIEESTLQAGDALRLGGVDRLRVDGRAELVLWDLPPLSR
jgi:redox-sensitive bicupin YhaK (pirin superfamily)